MPSRHPLILFTLDKRFYFFDFILEVLVYLHQALYGFASVYNGRMVAFCDELTDLGHGMVRILLGQEHGNLSCLDNLAFAALGLDSRLFDVVMLANLAEDGFDGNRLAFATYNGFAYDAFRQVHVDVPLQDDGVCQQ